MGTKLKIHHVSKETMELSFCDSQLEAKNEKLLGSSLDMKSIKQINAMILKLNSRLFLINRTKGYLSLHC